MKIPASQILPSKPIPEEIPTSITIKEGSVICWQAAYHIGGIYNGLLTWFDEQMQTSPQQLAAKVTDFIPAEMRLLFNDINFGEKPNFSIKS